MNLSKFNAFSKQGLIEECKTFFSATFLAVLVFGSVYAYDAYAVTSTQVETLTVTINASVTFAVSTNVFGTLDPGTSKIATSTIDVTTNATAWNVQLYGNNQGSGAASTTLFITADTATDNKIPDGSEWIPNAATTSPGNAVALAGGEDGLYFRVMTASGSVPFRSTSWWGTDDTPFSNARWAGIASSTVGRRIGIVNTYVSTQQLNTVQYYLDVAASQKQGNYTGDVTYTWTDSL